MAVSHLSDVNVDRFSDDLGKLESRCLRDVQVLRSLSAVLVRRVNVIRV